MLLVEPIPPLVKKALMIKYKFDGRDEGDETFNEYDLRDLHAEFELKRPFQFCKEYELLDEDNSGETFALQFMPYFNQFHYSY
jgi:hypothetical protein